MQSRNKILDDISQLMTNAMGVAHGAREEAETAMKSMIDRWLADRDFVTREEFDAVRAMAQKAREEMANLKADNERILKEARAERDQMLKEAREIRDNMVEESKQKAKDEAEKILVQARETIENEKKAALHDLRNTVGTLAIEVAEKVLRSELTNTGKSKELVDDYLNDISFN